jgi:protein involved in polysaccharide export with SLBB domain
MQVGGRTVQQVQSDLVVRFAKVTGRSAEVSVIVSERSPVYVVGPVRNAGAVKFVPGMTVLHALALAGGIDPMITRAHQASSLVESLQDVERARKIEDDVRRLQARRSRLEAERDRRDTLIPAKAVAGDMAGEEVRRAVFEAEEKVFKVEQAREREQQREQELVRQQIGAELQALRRKLAYFDGQIKVRQERLGDYQKLRAGGLSTSAPSMMLQTEIADLEGRRQDSLLAITQAEARLAQADSGASKLRAEKEATLTKSLFATEAELASLERALVAARAVLLVRDSQASGGGRRGSEMVYEVVRTGGAGGVATKVDEMASLAPGDILKIGFASTADGSGPTPAGTTGGGARAPAGRRATLEVVPK